MLEWDLLAPLVDPFPQISHLLDIQYKKRGIASLAVIYNNTINITQKFENIKDLDI